MINNQEEDEFVAVRVQDPRIQNEGSWNSYVDYKIFLHTNSKAFTAKTSCVRRRYSEFVWLRKKLQKNAGLVPVPDLPGRSFFSFSNEDFLERRRKGLQAFLDKVVHTTVCLSDSQLHLFLQTQLPIGHIQDCVQGHTPYSVTDAILTYASSNQGFFQAQEEDSIKDPSLTVSYESMESPVPHQPCLHTNEAFSPELFSCGDSEPLEVLLELRDQDKPTIRISQKSSHLEAVVEDSGKTDVSFYLSGSQEDTENINPTEEQRSCLMQIPVEVHLPMETASEYNMQQEQGDMDTEEKSVTDPDSQETENRENGKDEKCLTILDFKNSYEDQMMETTSHEVPEFGFSEKENHISEVNKAGVSLDIEKSDESGVKEEAHLQSENHDEPQNMNGGLEEEGGEQEARQETDVKQEVYLTGTKDESDVDSTHSLPSSNESIVKVSDEENMCEEMDDVNQPANGYTETPPEDSADWSGVEVTTRNMPDVQMNGCAVEKEEEQYMTDISILSKCGDLNSTVADGELTENSDFSILDSSCVPELVKGEFTEEQAALSSRPVDDSKDTEEVEVC